MKIKDITEWNPVPKLSFSLPLCNHGRKLREVMDAEIVIQ
jgi:hypothetical protein